MVVAEVRVELKEGVADPEGSNTRKALELLGFTGIENVQSIKVFEITMEDSADNALEAVDDMCKRLLANPVIHRYSIDIK